MVLALDGTVALVEGIVLGLLQLTEHLLVQRVEPVRHRHAFFVDGGGQRLGGGRVVIDHLLGEGLDRLVPASLERKLGLLVCPQRSGPP